VTLSPLAFRYILTTRVDATSYEDACDRIATWVQQRQSRYVVAANVHVVMTAYGDARYRQVLAHADLVTPDGMPLVWGLRALGLSHQTRVYGPDLMLAWCQRAAQTGISIYLYGGTPPVLAQLQATLTAQFPGLTIAGTHAPPVSAPLSPRGSGGSRSHSGLGGRGRVCGAGLPQARILDGAAAGSVVRRHGRGRCRL
jgi:N-acetylglucosaminyldiphosphoundecaprenol N-acetyl-beta-D-mannosaminyltransferase